MAIRVGPRLTLEDQMARRPENRRGLLAMEFYAPRVRGGKLRASEVVGKNPQEIQALALRVEGLRRVDIGIKMITISAGEFVFHGVRGVRHEGFKIAETPFTNGQFRVLLQKKPEDLAGIVKDPRERLIRSLSAVDPNYEQEAEDCPMVYLNNLTESAGLASLLSVRLLTELEWERAAAGQNGRRYSFGDEFDKNKVTFKGRGTRSVYAHRDAATPEGVLDLAGNVWEWTSTPRGYIDLSDPKNPKLPQSIDPYPVLRGGSWRTHDLDCFLAAHRSHLFPEMRGGDVGVRFAEDIG